jgi:hypothetical protein
MMTIIAIDPGKKGGIACKDQTDHVFVDTMPDTLRDLWDYFKAIRDAHGQDEVLAVIEKTGTHVKGNNASASCTFARSCGHLEMALTASEISWFDVTPQKWMKHFGALPKDKTERKRVIKERMQRRYPSISVTLTNADALGILTWAIEKERG